MRTHWLMISFNPCKVCSFSNSVSFHLITFSLPHSEFSYSFLIGIVRARKVAVLEEENQELMEKIAELEAQLAKKENAKKNTNTKRKNKTKKLLQ